MGRCPSDQREALSCCRVHMAVARVAKYAYAVLTAHELFHARRASDGAYLITGNDSGGGGELFADRVRPMDAREECELWLKAACLAPVWAATRFYLRACDPSYPLRRRAVTTYKPLRGYANTSCVLLDLPATVCDCHLCAADF